MKVGILRELAAGERRVAMDGPSAKKLVQAGFELLVERGAGLQAGIPDETYLASGARIVASAEEVWEADVILRIRAWGACPGGSDDFRHYRDGQVLIALLEPLYRPEATALGAATGCSAFALELIPRTTRAQTMDVLSSMSSIAGYRGVILAAHELPRLFGLMMTAAGTLLPARVLVLGAGVAGLQAIASAKRMGAVVSAYDVRPAAREQVESVGGRFIDLGLDTRSAEDAGGYAVSLGEDFYRRQTEALAEHVAAADVVLCTAAIPGAESPRLVTADATRRMRPGSVIIDLAADRGGNCELTRPDERVENHGVTILGPTHIASQVPAHASQMFASNVTQFLLAASRQGIFAPPPDDEIYGATHVCHSGAIVHPAVRKVLGIVVGLILAFTAVPSHGLAEDSSPPPAMRPERPVAESVEVSVAPDETATPPRRDHSVALVTSLTIFTLAVFVGFEVIVKVPPTLHTPLMSGSNAISGITVVGAILLAGCSGSWFAAGVGFLATILAMINVVGGFVVTDRMLAMFRPRPSGPVSPPVLPK